MTGQRLVLALIVAISFGIAVAWVFYVPILEAPDETVHFEYSTAIYAAGGLLPPRDAAHASVPAGRAIPDPVYMEDASAVAVIAEKPDVKAPAGYGPKFFGAVDSGSHRAESDSQLLDPPLLRYYPFGYYLLDAAFMAVASLFTSSPVAMFFAARLLSAALLVPSLLLTFGVLRRLGAGARFSLLVTGVVGLFPMTSMMASSVQSDSLSFTLVMLSMFAALQVRRRPHDARWIALLGLALGCLLVTKLHYFLIVGIAVGAMLVTQRFERRDLRHAGRELVLLFAPGVVLESVQTWMQWSAPPLIATGQLGDLPDYRQALAAGPVATATYAVHAVTFTFLDHVVGREFGSFWGAFGWVDTPLVLGTPGITTMVWFAIAGVSVVLFVCTLLRVAGVSWRLFRVARRGRVKLAFRMAFSNPLVVAFLLLAVFLLSVEGYPGIQGRYYFPLLPAVFWIALRYAPRSLPGKLGPALFKLQAGGLVAYTLAGAIFAFPTLTARYYGHGRDLVPVTRETLLLIDSPGRYEVTRIRLPEATLGVGDLPTGRVGVVGWAVDALAGAPAKTVFIDIDGAPYQQAVYGDDSPAAAAAMGSDRFARSGFDAILDTTSLNRGPHELTIRVVSADGLRLYAPGPAIEFTAGVSLPPGSS